MGRAQLASGAFEPTPRNAHQRPPGGPAAGLLRVLHFASTIPIFAHKATGGQNAIKIRR
jgi:hypothetical protein